jgi:hypothetical protein
VSDRNLITPGEARAILELPKSTFFWHQRRGAFVCCLAPRPLGIRKYDRVRIQQWKDAQSPNRLSRRAS